MEPAKTLVGAASFPLVTSGRTGLWMPLETAMWEYGYQGQEVGRPRAQWFIIGCFAGVRAKIKTGNSSTCSFCLFCKPLVWMIAFRDPVNWLQEDKLPLSLNITVYFYFHPKTLASSLNWRGRSQNKYRTDWKFEKHELLICFLSCSLSLSKTADCFFNMRLKKDFIISQIKNALRN